MARSRRWLAPAFALIMTAAVGAQERPKGAPVPAKPAATAPSPAQVRTPAAAPAPQPPRAETLEEIVERVKLRLKQQELAVRLPKPPAPPPPPPRVKLVWRPSVVWPTELTPEPASMPPAPERKRVTLSWESAP
jgi:hypothetical protein